MIIYSSKEVTVKKISNTPKKIKYKVTYKKKSHSIGVLFYSPIPEIGLRGVILDALSKQIKSDFGAK